MITILEKTIESGKMFYLVQIDDEPPKKYFGEALKQLILGVRIDEVVWK